MLILWQDQVAAVAHAVAAASVEARLVAQEAVSQVEEALAVALSVADQAEVLVQALIILPHPHIITGHITMDRFSGDRKDALSFMEAVSEVAV